MQRTLTKRRKMFDDQYKVPPELLLNDSDAAKSLGDTGGFGKTTNSSVPDPFRFKLQYSREEAAEMLSVSPRTLDRLIAEKQLPIRRIGRRVLITHNALEQFTRRDHATGGTV